MLSSASPVASAQSGGPPVRTATAVCPARSSTLAAVAARSPCPHMITTGRSCTAAAWHAAGQPVAATPLLCPGQVDPAAVIDVRQAGEYAGGHLPGARNIELGALDGRAAGLETGPVVTMCGHGERAASAASVLERAGHTAVAILPGGPGDWADATGLVLERGA